MIVCEVGLNHQGDENYAHEYIDKIIESNADAILLHIREPSFYSKNGNSKFVLSDTFYEEIAKKIKKFNLKFGITISDVNKVDFFEKIDIDFYKIFSKDVRNNELIKKALETKKRVFISTGMSNLEELNELMKTIQNYKKQITLIHTQLSNKLKLVNLKAIPLLKKKFNLPVAYGNHAENTKVMFVALAFEPSDIIFYVKGSKYSQHLDEPHAVQLDDLKEFISDLKNLHFTLGENIKIKMKSQI